MMHYVEHHGVEIIIAYMAFAALVSSMPPLPDGASYWSKWVYGFLHAAASNWRGAMSIMKIEVPQDPNSITTNTVIKSTKVINTTEKPEELK